MTEITIKGVKVELRRGDLAHQPDLEVVVNAANAQLSGGGGVDGALHRAAGPKLKQASEPLGPIAPGEAVITPGFKLPNEWVIHCLGPVYGEDKPEEIRLANCYKNALKLAEEKGCTSIGFPAISCGAFGYPMKEAAKIALNTLKKEAVNLSSITKIWMVLWSEEAMDIHKKAMNYVLGQGQP